MCDKWFRIQSALCDQPQDFLTIAAVYTAGLEGEVPYISGSGSV